MKECKYELCTLKFDNTMKPQYVIRPSLIIGLVAAVVMGYKNPTSPYSKLFVIIVMSLCVVNILWEFSQRLSVSIFKDISIKLLTTIFAVLAVGTSCLLLFSSLKYSYISGLLLISFVIVTVCLIWRVYAFYVKNKTC